MRKQTRSAREQIATHLRADESVGRVFAVMLPLPNAGGAWGPAAIVVPLVAIVSKAMWNRAAATAQQEVGVPVRTRMVWALTDQRILLFSALKRWEIGEWLGELARTDVIGATAPAVGMGWRPVILELTRARQLTIKVGSTLADDVAAEFATAQRTGTDVDG